MTINYREEDVVTRVMDETNGEGVDHICEVEFGGNIRITEQVIKTNGCVSIYASKGELNPVVPMDVFMARNIKVWPFMLPITPPHRPGRCPSGHRDMARRSETYPPRRRRISPRGNRGCT